MNTKLKVHIGMITIFGGMAFLLVFYPLAFIMIMFGTVMLFFLYMLYKTLFNELVEMIEEKQARLEREKRQAEKEAEREKWLAQHAVKGNLND